jgi:hypothetical protein
VWETLKNTKIQKKIKKREEKPVRSAMRRWRVHPDGTVGDFVRE